MIHVINSNQDPYINHALEEYYLRYGSDEVFMLWRNRPSILIGRNQNIYEEVDVESAKQSGIDIVRRLSGGGTVYCDPGNINFTCIMAKTRGYLGFERFAAPIVEALRDIGVEAVFSGRNDILVCGGKISGNAQFHHQDRILHHGTLLFDGDIERLNGVLTPSKLKLSSKGLKSTRSRVTNIKEHLDDRAFGEGLLPDGSIEGFMEYLTRSVKVKLGITKDEHPSAEILEMAERIADKRFRTWQWNYGDSPAGILVHEARYSFGTISYRAGIIGGRLTDVSISGDFFGEIGIDMLCKSLEGTAFDAEAMKEALDGVDIDKYISGMEIEEFISGWMGISNADARHSIWRAE